MYAVRQFAALVVAGVVAFPASASVPPPGMAPSQGPALTVAELKAINDSERGLIRSAVIEEVVTTTYRNRPGEDEELRKRMGALIRAGRMSSQRTDVDQHVLVWHLNKNVTIARTRTIDFVRRAVRYDDVDIRDITGIISAYGLSGRSASGLDKTRSLIMRQGKTVLLKDDSRLAVVSPPMGSDFEWGMEQRSFGLIPSFVFDDSNVLDIVRGVDEEGESIVVVGHELELAGPTVFRVHIRPQLGYRVTRTVVYDAEGSPVQEFVASDFREVDSVLLPFRTVVRRARDGIQNYAVQETTVKSIRLNVDVPADHFSIPSGYRVQDIVHNRMYKAE